VKASLIFREVEVFEGNRKLREIARLSPGEKKDSKRNGRRV